MLTNDDLNTLAELSMLKLSETELGELSKDMEGIIGYVSAITQFPLSKIAAERPVLRNVLRLDIQTNEPGFGTDALVALAPTHDGGYIKVKKIIP